MRRIRNLFRNIKFCHQRVKWGWCEQDAWNMDVWFLNVAPQMLRYLQKTSHGCPCNMTMKRWKRILKHIAFLLREASEDTCSMKNEFNAKKEPKKYQERMLQIACYRETCKNLALEDFNKYFWDLWD